MLLLLFVSVDGYKFYLSENNVILCSGDESGILHRKYFKNVVDRKSGDSGVNNILIYI